MLEDGCLEPVEVRSTVDAQDRDGVAVRSIDPLLVLQRPLGAKAGAVRGDDRTQLVDELVDRVSSNNTAVRPSPSRSRRGSDSNRPGPLAGQNFAIGGLDKGGIALQRGTKAGRKTTKQAIDHEAT